MADILDYIDKMQIMYGDKEPSSMDQEPRIGLDVGGALTMDVIRVLEDKQNFRDAWKNYKKSTRGSRPLSPGQFFKIWARENMAKGGSAGQLVQPNNDGSRPGYAGDTFLVKVGSPVKENNVIEQKFIEVTGSKNRPETYKKTGVEKTLYKPQIVVGNKTVLTTDFGSKNSATATIKKYRKTTPIKNAPPNLNTLDEKKKKKYLEKRERSDKIIKRGGVESFETGDDVIHKGHSQNIDNPNVKIKPSNIIYTPKKINQSMGGQGSKISPTDLDYKIDVAEDKIRDIKKSNMSGAKKKVELEKLDTKLMKYVDDSNGYKTVTLSGGNTYGEIFQKSKSMDMFDEFPDMTEKETKKFVNQYFNDEGKLKDKWTKGNVSSVDKANIQKSYVFLENIKNAKSNAKKLKKASKFELTKLALIGCPGKAMGGRIGFSNGQNLTSCATKGVTKLQGDISKLSPGDQANLKKLTKSAKAVKFLRGVVGPGAILTEVILAGGIAANKFFEGMPIKQALAESDINKYLLGPKLQIDLEAERAKEMAKGEEYAMAERGRRKAPFMAQSKAADKLRRKEAMEKMEEKFPTYTNKDIDAILKQQNLSNPNQANKEFGYDFGMQQKQPGIGDMEYNEEVAYNDINKMMRLDDRNRYFADNFRQEKAGGGIAGLSGGDKSGAAPTRGPQSQGLFSLRNNVKKR